MIVLVSPEELDLFYQQATDSYWSCIHHPENAFLQAEVTVPLPDVIVKPAEVKIVLLPESPDAHQVEVVLWLYAHQEHIGKYIYLMKNNGQVVDDSLVFY